MRIKDRLTSFLFYCPVFNKKSCPILQTDKTIGTAWLNTAKRPLSLNTKSNAQLFSVLAFLVSNCAGSLASRLAGSLASAAAALSSSLLKVSLIDGLDVLHLKFPPEKII